MPNINITQSSGYLERLALSILFSPEESVLLGAENRPYVLIVAGSVLEGLTLASAPGPGSGVFKRLPTGSNTRIVASVRYTGLPVGQLFPSQAVHVTMRATNGIITVDPHDLTTNTRRRPRIIHPRQPAVLPERKSQLVTLKQGLKEMNALLKQVGGKAWVDDAGKYRAKVISTEDF